MTTFANALTPPASTFAACATPPSSSFSSDPSTPPPSIFIECVGVPTLTSLVPITGRIASVVQVTLRGTRFLPGATVQVSGTGITVSNVVVADPTTITARFTIAPGATISGRTVTVTTLQGVTGGQTFTVTAPGGITQAPAVWFEADVGITDADNTLLTKWAEQMQSGADLWPVLSGTTAPTYRSGGFGGQASLPRLVFAGSQGLETLFPIVYASLNWTTSTVFVVANRGAGDGNGSLYEHFNAVDILTGLRDRAFCAYAARRVLGTLLESGREKVNAATTWMPRGARKLWRHEHDGTNAGNKLFESGVDQALVNGTVTTNPGTSASGSGGLLVGARPGTSALNFTGDYAALMAYSPKLSSADELAVEAYLAKWFVTDVALRGPITLATQVIGGVTITVENWAAVSGGRSGDFQSSDVWRHALIIRFSQAIRYFQVDRNYSEDVAVGGACAMYGCDDLVNNVVVNPVASAVFVAPVSVVADPERQSLSYTPGFKTVVIQDSIIGPNHGFSQLFPTYSGAKFLLTTD